MGNGQMLQRRQLQAAILRHGTTSQNANANANPQSFSRPSRAFSCPRDDQQRHVQRLGRAAAPAAGSRGWSAHRQGLCLLCACCESAESSLHPEMTTCQAGSALHGQGAECEHPWALTLDHGGCGG
jgi:hypothetical protein